MRIRTGRFDGLRLAGKRWDSQLVEESVRQRPVERHRRVVPPAAAVAGNFPGRVRGYSASRSLAEYPRTRPGKLPATAAAGGTTRRWRSTGRCRTLSSTSWESQRLPANLNPSNRPVRIRMPGGVAGDAED